MKNTFKYTIIVCNKPDPNYKEDIYLTEEGYLDNDIREAILFSTVDKAKQYIEILDDPEDFYTQDIEITFECIKG